MTDFDTSLGISGLTSTALQGLPATSRVLSCWPPATGLTHYMHAAGSAVLQEHWQQQVGRCAATSVGQGHGQLALRQSHRERAERPLTQRMEQHDQLAVTVSCQEPG